jgi:uncharacterized SAM-binding protein YcdF (DUF218 family)
MWLLHFFSDGFIAFVVHAVLILGIVGCFLTFGLLNRLLRLLPMLSAYYQALRAVSVVFLLGGIYLQGGYSTEMAWRERVREMEAKVAQAEEESKSANEKLAASGKEKIQVVREKGQVIKQYITREITQYDNTCAIPKEVVRAHNAAAKNEEIK